MHITKPKIVNQDLTQNICELYIQIYLIALKRLGTYE